jgi:hypothetical protein
MKTKIVIDTYSLSTEQDSEFIKGQQADWCSFLTAHLTTRHPNADLVIVWETKGKTKVRAGEGGETDEALQDLVRTQVRAAWTTWCVGGSAGLN